MVQRPAAEHWVVARFCSLRSIRRAVVERPLVVVSRVSRDQCDVDTYPRQSSMQPERRTLHQMDRPPQIVACEEQDMRFFLGSMIFVALGAVLASAGVSVMSGWQAWAVFVLVALHSIVDLVFRGPP